MITMEQVHGGRVVAMDRSDLGDVSSHFVVDADAVLVSGRKLFVAVKTADCLPILLWHPSGVVGAIHAGRLGSECRIIQRVLRCLDVVFSLSSEFVFWFGPSIRGLHYQINREKDLYYDLVATNRTQIMSLLSSDTYRIIDSMECTICHNHRYFSYRKDGPKTGRIWSFITT